MSKPEDIPQDVWDAAHAIDIDADFSWDSQVNGTSAYIAVREGIARAIMAAKAEEREACVFLANEIAAGRSRQKMQATIAKKRTEARDFESMAISAIDVSYAIRQRGEQKQ